MKTNLSLAIILVLVFGFAWVSYATPLDDWKISMALDCATITGSAALCDGDDATGGGATTLTSSATVSDAVIATLTPITGLSFTAAASTNYLIDCFLIASSSVATTGMSFAWDTPASPTLILMTGFMPIAVATGGTFLQRVDNTNIGITTAVIAAFTTYPVVLHTMFKNGSNATTMSLGFTPETANRVDIVVGSVCQYRTY